jgi:DNA-binding CsgD family transcriptional regulator
MADRTAPDQPAELERLAMDEYLAGHEAESLEMLTRAHHLSVDRGDTRLAARSAFWIAFTLIGMGDRSRVSGWTARARRLLDEDRRDCVEHGYVMLPEALERVAAGDLASAESMFADANRIGRRFNDPDLASLALQGRGRVLVALGHFAEGVALFDEVMVAVTAGELKPFVAGVVYCSVISACLDLCDVNRAREWTGALDDWCASRPNLVQYRGECQVHRAEILRLRGQWPEALDEAQHACLALSATRRFARGAALYEVAELHRLRGLAAEAEDAYRLAGESGRSSHPGLALLRLSQGRHDEARAAIMRLVAERTWGRQRCDILAAAVEILLACGDPPEARRMADQLQALAVAIDTPLVRAVSARAEGAVRLASGDAHGALAPLRDALAIWQELEAPYEGARARALVGLACRQLGDAEGARMELTSAAQVFRELGATPSLASLDVLDERPPAPPGGLTSREIEVLQLVARGKTNRAIARELAISEKTVARHLSNIFTKLDLPSRTAAAAYAFTHHLVGRTPT